MAMRRTAYRTAVQCTPYLYTRTTADFLPIFARLLLQPAPIRRRCCCLYTDCVPRLCDRAAHRARLLCACTLLCCVRWHIAMLCACMLLLCAGTMLCRALARFDDVRWHIHAARLRAVVLCAGTLLMLAKACVPPPLWLAQCCRAMALSSCSPRRACCRLTAGASAPSAPGGGVSARARSRPSALLPAATLVFTTAVWIPPATGRDPPRLRSPPHLHSGQTPVTS